MIAKPGRGRAPARRRWRTWLRKPVLSRRGPAPPRGGRSTNAGRPSQEESPRATGGVTDPVGRLVRLHHVDDRPGSAPAG